MSELRLNFSLCLPLDHFDLNVVAEFNSLTTGIFGASGSGKTSLLRCLAGLDKNATGTISFNGEEWLNSEKKVFVAPENRRIGYVPQNGLLFPNKNVLENLSVGEHRKRSEHSMSTLELVCELLDLSRLLQRSTLKLSGGERQRVALGRALLSDPDLLLLDEPLAALDIKLKRQVLPYLQRVREELHIPMVMISHNPAEIQALCDDVLIADGGKVVSFGKASDVFFSKKVLNLTQGEFYENILPATVAESENEASSTSRLKLVGKDSEVILLTSKVEAPIETKLMVGIPANDIIVATNKPENISAQNILQVTIEKIEPANAKYMICSSLAKDLELNAEISYESLQRLGLEVGKSVYFVIKSGACVLYQ